VGILFFFLTSFAWAQRPPALVEVGTGTTTVDFAAQFPAQHRIHADQLITRPAPSELEHVYGEFAEVFLTFFSKSLAPPSGIENPNNSENGYADFLVPIGASQCSGTIQGSTNLRYLSGPYFYNENNGAFGVRCNLLSKSMKDTVISVQISPAAGSIALIRYHSMVPAPEGESPPTQVFLGSMAGIEAFHRFHAGVTAGLRLYVRGELDATSGGRVGGVSNYEAAYLRFDIDQLIPRTLQIPISIMLTAQAFDRGAHRSTIYDFEEITPRGAEMIRTGLEGVLSISIKF
jgi:hypothetical protein